MYCERYNCVFIHNRKCAGTSIIRTFGLDPDQAAWHVLNDGVLSPEWPRLRVAAPDVFVFSCVRNPFDRLVSAWRYLAATAGRSLEAVLEDPPMEGHDYRHLARPQADILIDAATGAPVTHALMRYETLDDDFATICARLGRPTQPLPLTNQTDRDRDYRRYFTPKARKLAQDRFARDLALFGYEF